MAIFVLSIRRHDDWVEIARFEATGPADAMNKARHVIPADYGDGPIQLREQPAADSQPFYPRPGGSN
ncbi:MAG TPA: hypothetical protein VGI81_05795 [Tepidisphaeraceae bacterium]|jgi:hypothetical protein